MKYSFLKENCSRFSVKKMADMLDISRSGYYSWLTRPESRRSRDNQIIKERIEEIFEDNRKVYGSPRITNSLREEGLRIGCNRVARIMKINGISAKINKKFRVQTTDSNHDFPISPNRLKQKFQASRPNRIWVSDITYIKIGIKWAYLCIIEDLFNNEIVGWSFASHMRTEMVIAAFRSAVNKRNPDSGLIFHSDRGSQYASHDFRQELENHDFKSSMSRKGNCYDNAPAESFFHTLKNEEVRRKKYKSFKEAKRNLFDYIEVFYNRRRKHSSLGYLSPVQYLEMSA